MHLYERAGDDDAACRVGKNGGRQRVECADALEGVLQHQPRGAGGLQDLRQEEASTSELLRMILLRYEPASERGSGRGPGDQGSNAWSTR